MAAQTRANVFHRLIWASRLGVLLLVIVVAVSLDASSSSSHRNDVRQQWQEKTDEISLKLQSAILQNIQTVWGLAANVAIQPDIDGQRFRELASVIFSLAPELRNIGLAPDFVIRHVYPLAGNEAAIGLDLTAQSLSQDQIEMLLNTRRVVFTGPIDLVQGGQGLAGRVPIFEQASGDFWGVISVILDLQKLYSSIGLDRLQDDFNVAISSSADVNDTQSVFFSTRPFQWEDPVTSTIRMRGATWVVFAEPVGGWPNHPSQPWIFRGSLFAMLVIVSGAVFWLTSLMSRDREMQRRLWGLFELAPMGIGLFSVTSNRLLRANPTFENQFGRSVQTLDFFDQPLDVHGEPLANRPGVQETLREHARLSGLEGYFMTPGQELAPVMLHGLQLDDDGNEPVVWLITEDISERKKVDHLKNEFISTVSHELRTPLTSISGSLGLLANNAVGELPEKASKLAHIAYRNSQQLTFLINDLLDMEKLVAGKMPFRSEHHVLQNLVHESVENIATFAQQRDIHLQVAELPAVTVHVDRQRLNQAITNLLSNAIKFSPAGSSVDIFASQRGESVRLCIRNHGEGVAPHFREHIFKKFSQADSSDRRASGGTGLGLAITRELMARMKGTVDYESVPGEGATFWLELPVAG
ncbi:CHASE domain-containing protein [Marinobacter salarius]|uniref:histidine kinase n=1 Tax=Marinobacter salarius TaxID=1420917 RepID=A0ABY1FT26_9GAMM|nr:MULTISPECIES: ATP-binding protein [Marinobacter]KXJ47174.1 MAG: histidine kinase [Marinobacter sp. Hex_13]SFM03702.1 CHASE domain-containing protein [Marinobacter salarius]